MGAWESYLLPEMHPTPHRCTQPFHRYAPYIRIDAPNIRILCTQPFHRYAPNIRIDAPNRFCMDTPNILIDAPNIAYMHPALSA